MTASVVGSRVAGKVLGDFLSLAGKDLFGAAKSLGSATTKAVANIPLVQQIGTGTAEEAAKAIVANPLLNRAATVLPVSVPAWQAGAAALPQVAGGLAIAGGGLGSYKLLSELSRSADTSMAKTAPFATQQYMPGTLSMTNEQAGDYFLNQQRYMHQLNLIAARQRASQPQAASNYGDSSDAISQAWSQPVSYG